MPKLDVCASHRAGAHEIFVESGRKGGRRRRELAAERKPCDVTTCRGLQREIERAIQLAAEGKDRASMAVTAAVRAGLELLEVAGAEELEELRERVAEVVASRNGRRLVEHPQIASPLRESAIAAQPAEIADSSSEACQLDIHSSPIPVDNGAVADTPRPPAFEEGKP